jgi:hypothetical protein
MSSIFDALNNDPYKPAILKPSLAQWDNYQLHNLYCVDTRRQEVTTIGGAVTSTIDSTIVFKSLIAVQAYSFKDIPCNFDAIVRAYL